MPVLKIRKDNQWVEVNGAVDNVFVNGTNDWSQNDPVASDYIKNRTHYLKSSSSTEIFPEEVITFTDGVYIPEETMQLSLEADNKYIVRWDDMYYECVCIQHVFEDDGVVIYYLGNVAAVYGEGVNEYGYDFGHVTGHPFCLQYFTMTESSDSNTVSLRPLDGKDSVTFNITKKDEDISKLDVKYINADWSATSTYFPVIEDLEVIIESSGTPSFDGTVLANFMSNMYNTHSSYPDVLWLRVVWDGVYYYAPLFIGDWGSMSGVPMWGNCQFASSTNPESPYPFVILYVLGMLMIYGEQGTHTVSADIISFNKMPEYFLPESVDSVVVRSSTEGSTKRFKLTVDDSGTISATEIT